MAENFFDEQMEQSKVKTAIVSKYFIAWARVISATLKRSTDKRIAYVDLFAGPGRYRDGAKSTPVFILEQAIADPMLRDNFGDVVQRWRCQQHKLADSSSSITTIYWIFETSTAD